MKRSTQWILDRLLQRFLLCWLELSRGLGISTRPWKGENEPHPTEENNIESALNLKPVGTHSAVPSGVREFYLQVQETQGGVKD